MVTHTLKNLFVIAIFLLFMHAIEEYLTGFYKVDPFIIYLGKALNNSLYAFILVETAWFVLLFSILFFIKGKWQLWLMIVIGVTLILEVEHIIRAILNSQYYPGTITAFLMLIFSFFYWKEIVKLKLRG